jgi:hypothetical protein
LRVDLLPLEPLVRAHRVRYPRQLGEVAHRFTLVELRTALTHQPHEAERAHFETSLTLRVAVDDVQ